MIERKFINQKIKEFEIKEYIKNNLSRVGLSDVKLQRTPMGEKILISTSRPGLVVGRSGSNITKLTKDLKSVFGLENPQIEIDEISNIGLDANIIAEMIANSLEKFGLARFKGIGHKAMQDVMNGGALGVEILMSGKIPSARARTWRFYQGYLKKCGDIAVSQVKVAYSHADLKSGTVGIKVSIMTPDIELPDQIKINQPGQPVTVSEEPVEEITEVSEENSEKSNESEDSSDKKEKKAKKSKDEKDKKGSKEKSDKKEKKAKKSKDEKQTPAALNEESEIKASEAKANEESAE
jgi:small subunit ribosomal protein S3